MCPSTRSLVIRISNEGTNLALNGRQILIILGIEKGCGSFTPGQPFRHGIKWLLVSCLRKVKVGLYPLDSVVQRAFEGLND